MLRTHGYTPDVGRIVRTCGIASIPAAFLGCHSLTLAALLANVVGGPDADPLPRKRWTAAAWGAIFCALVGLFAGTVLQAMGALPAAAITALAGLALLGPLTQSLSAAFTTPASGTPLAPVAIIVVGLSGIAPWGIGSAFWGIVAGLAVYGSELAWARRPWAARKDVGTPTTAPLPPSNVVPRSSTEPSPDSTTPVARDLKTAAAAS